MGQTIYCVSMEVSSLWGSALMMKTQLFSPNTKSNNHTTKVGKLYGFASDLWLSG